MKRRGRRLLALVVLAAGGVLAYQAMQRRKAGAAGDRIVLQPRDPAGGALDLDTIRDRATSGVYDEPHELYFGAERQLVDAMIGSGYAGFNPRTGVHSTPQATAEDMRALAEIECRRAVDDFGMPASLVAECVDKVGQPRSVRLADRMYRYEPPGARYVVDIHL